jgi:tetratricopeptide (TPR) repeat protein
VREDPSLPGLVGEGLAPTYRALAKLKLAQQSPEQSLAFFEKAREALEAVVRAHPRIADYGKSLVEVYLDLADFHRRAGHSPEQLASLEKARTLQEQLAASHPSLPFHTQQLATIHHQLGNFYRRNAKDDAALGHYQTALDLYDRLPPTMRGLPQTTREIGWTQGYVALIKQMRGDLSGSIKAFEQARIIQATIQEGAGSTTSDVLNLANTCGLLGLVHKATGRLDEAAACFEKALSLFAGLVSQKVPHLTAGMDVAGMQLNLARVAQQKGRHPQALDWLDRSICTLNELQPDPAIQKQVGEVLRQAYLGRLQSLGHLGRSIEASAEADKLLTRWPEDPRLLYEMTCVFAWMASANRQDVGLGEEERKKRCEASGKRAVELLVRAEGKGLFPGPEDALRLRTDPALENLRSRDDFRQLLERIGSKHLPKLERP